MIFKTKNISIKMKFTNHWPESKQIKEINTNFIIMEKKWKKR
jgi:hypothetical protein